MIAKKNVSTVRVRYAPSPTGPLNLGNVRTALFNWIFAKHEGGVFVLRIEDTDRERSKAEYEDEIKSSLEWLGLKHDEFYRQSERLSIYTNYLNKLISNKLAYYCFCKEEELEAEYQSQISEGIFPVYSGRCRLLSEQDVAIKIKDGENFVIRFKMTDKSVSFQDLIRGKTTFDLKLIGDIIIAKSLKEPLYNFANVIDDYEMNITHVLRGEDHISNTPKQLAMYEALDLEPPLYAHLPLILGPDKKKLSKRYMAKSILDHKNEGYLSESLINFLTLLGWHPKGDKEIFTIKDTINDFSLDRVQKSGAIFMPEKLDWFNSYYIKKLDLNSLFNLISKFVKKEWLEDEEKLKKVILLEKERISKLSDFSSGAEMFFERGDYNKEILNWKDDNFDKTVENLKSLENIIEEIPSEIFSKEELESKIMPFADALGRGSVLWPLRVALSSSKTSPAPFEIADAIGKNETLERIRIAIKKASI